MTNQIHSGTLEIKLSAREEKHRRFARKAAAEGMVLLKNEGVLPLNVDSSIALFGGGAVQTIKGGTGSGLSLIHISQRGQHSGPQERNVYAALY